MRRGLMDAGRKITLLAVYLTMLASWQAPAEGQAAEGGDGDNSRCTLALAAAMGTPGVELDDVFKDAGRQVAAATASRQVPWMEGSWQGKFFFAPPASRPAAKPDSPSLAGAAPEPAIAVSVEGHETKAETVSQGDSPTVRRIGLSKLLRAGSRFRDCPECPEMAVVPAGSFLMGSPDTEVGRLSHEGPVHRVTIRSPFAVGVHEVTFAEWDACASSGGCQGLRPSDNGWGRGQRPVINVSWDDAKSYVQWLSSRTSERYRLLSESEWEYMARAETRTARWWGEGESVQCSHANGTDAELPPDCIGILGEFIQCGRDAASEGFSWMVGCSDGHSHTASVGSFRANAWGLYDVLGNVFEWTEDCWNGNRRSGPSDGSAYEHGDCNLRVLRGGAWGSKPRYLRSASRSRSTTSERNSDVGFRVARTLTP